MKFNPLENAIERGILDYMKTKPPHDVWCESYSEGHDVKHHKVRIKSSINMLELVPAIAARVAALAKDGEHE